MVDSGFTHLHVHSEYSLLDGAASVKKLVSTCKELGMDSIALTDHGNMFGAIAFYQAALKQSRKYTGLEWTEFRQKMGAFLARRGFNYGVAAPVIEQVWSEMQV